MAGKQYTISARIEGTDAFTPAARSATRSGEELVRALEEIGVEANQARAAVDEFADGVREGAEEAARASKKVEDTGGAFSRLGSFLKDRFVITLGDVTGAVRSVAGAVTSLVGSAQASEDSLNRLASAAARYGTAAAATVSAANAQALAIQQQTRFSDEAVRSAQALLITLGVSKDQLAEATQASADLAAAFGTDLDSAARNVGKTVGGFAGELGEVVPGLKSLSAEALQAGEGITVLADSFSGRAIADAQTFSGAIDQLSNAISDIGTAAGQAVTSSATIRKSLQDIREEAQNPKTVEGLSTLAGGFTLFFSTVAELGAKGLGALGRGLEEVATQLDNFGLNVTESFMPPVIQARTEVDRWFGVLLNAATPFRVVTDAVDGASAAAERAAALAERNRRVYEDLGVAQGEAAKLATELGIVLDNNLNTALEENEQRLVRAIELEKQGVLSKGDLIRAEIAYTKTKQELLDALNNEEEATKKSGKALEDHATKADQAAAANDRLNASLRQTQVAATNAALALVEVRGRDGEILPSGGELSLGGTRYTPPPRIDPRTGRVYRDGSRLVGSVNGQRNSASNIGSNGVGTTSGYYPVNTPQYGTIQAFKQGGGSGFGPGGLGTTVFGLLPGGRVVRLFDE